MPERLNSSELRYIVAGVARACYIGSSNHVENQDRSMNIWPQCANLSALARTAYLISRVNAFGWRCELLHMCTTTPALLYNNLIRAHKADKNYYAPPQ